MREPGQVATALKSAFSLELSSKLTCSLERSCQLAVLAPQEAARRPRKLPGGRKNHQKRCTVHDFQLFGQTRLRRRQERSRSRLGDAKTGPNAVQASPTAPQSSPRAVQIGSGGAQQLPGWPRRLMGPFWKRIGCFWTGFGGPRGPSGVVCGRPRQPPSFEKANRRDHGEVRPQT